MATLGFFIDTGGRPDSEEEEEEEVVATEEAEAALGVEDVKTEAKLRERASKERSLASFLFGKTSQLNSADDESDQSESDQEEQEEEEEQDAADSEEEEQEQEQEQPSSVQPSLPGDWLMLEKGGRRKRKAAWEDEEDGEVLVKEVAATYSKAVGKHGQQDTSTELYHRAVQRKFKSVVGEPSWANLDREEGDSDEEFFRETTEMLDKTGRGQYLESGRLNSRKLKDLNFCSHREGAVIRAAEFHPSSTVGLVAGNNGTVTLVQVDGKENPKLQTVNFQNFSIRTAKFSSCGNEFIVGSPNHPHFYVYDMITGQSRKVGLTEPLNTLLFSLLARCPGETRPQTTGLASSMSLLTEDCWPSLAGCDIQYLRRSTV